MFYLVLFWGSERPAEGLWDHCHIRHNKGWCHVSHYMCPASRSIIIKSRAKLSSKISSSMWQALSSTKQSLSTPRQPSYIAEISIVAQHAGQKTQLSNFFFVCGFVFFFFLSGHLWPKCSGYDKLPATFWIVQYKTKFFSECYVVYIAISINLMFFRERKCPSLEIYNMWSLSPERILTAWLP